MTVPAGTRLFQVAQSHLFGAPGDYAARVTYVAGQYFAEFGGVCSVAFKISVRDFGPGD